MVVLSLSHTSHIRTLANPWTAACQAPLSMGFPKQKYWSESPFPSPGDLPDPRIELASPRPPPALAGQFFTTSTTGEASKDITQEQLDGRDTKGMGKGTGSRLSMATTLPGPPRVHQPESSLKPILWGFYRGFLD